LRKGRFVRNGAWAFILLCCGLLAPPALSAATKRAVLIGIDDYAYVRDLQGAANDVALMKQLLTTVYGFEAQDITVLTNSEATRARILTELHALADRLEEGDVVVLHFSGHGSAVQDRNDDELDRMDETLVAYDGKQTGEGQILDDEIHDFVRQASAITRNITVIFDSCHSGGGIRELPSVWDRWIPPAATARGGIIAGGDDEFRRLSGYVFISSARYDQKAREFEARNGQKHGILSYYLSEALREGRTETYRTLADLLKMTVPLANPKQTPDIEGPNLDNRIFGTERVSHEPYILATTEESDNRVYLEGGRVHGVNEGSVYALYSVYTARFNDPADSLGTVVIDRVGPTDAYGNFLPRGGGDGIQPVMRAVLRDHKTPNRYLSVALPNAPDTEELRTLERALGSENHVRVRHDQGAQVRIEQAGNRFHLIPVDPGLNAVSIDASNTELTVASLRSLARWYNTLAISNPASDVEVTVTLEGLDGRPLRSSDADRGTVIGPSDDYVVAVSHDSPSPLYIYILQLSSDGGVYLLERSRPSERVARGQVVRSLSYRTEFDTDQPELREIIKVLVTDRPIDMAPLVQDGLKAPPSGQGSLMDMLLQGMLGMFRDPEPVDGTWDTAELSFIVRR
jgi:uncharacterized caspase-like protein